QGEGDDPALELAKKMSLDAHQEKGEGEEFLATAYPKVHENLKLITDERVIVDNPESHSGSMSSMKNLEDTDNFGDQFLYNKPTEDDQEKSKVSLSRIKNLKRVRKRLSDSKGNGQRMTRGGANTSSQRSIKNYRSGGSFEVWKALLEEE
ncbi:hypothetical protein Tco_0785683, partial [Tanacetum coccineum]